MEKVRCSECNDFKDPDARCSTCRSNDRYRRLGIAVERRCKSCLAVKKLTSNNECRRCLREAGLHECTVCHEPSILELEFKSKQSVCRRCRHPLAHLTIRERARHAQYMRKYGISFDEYVRRGSAQGGLCGICSRKRRLVVDHDHKTGVVRGLLCSGCNSGLGMMADAPAVLRAAAAYIERSGTQKQVEVETAAPARAEHLNRVMAADNERLTAECESLRQRNRYQDPEFTLSLIRSMLSMIEHRCRPLTESQAERYRTWLNDVMREVATPREP